MLWAEGKKAFINHTKFWILISRKYQNFKNLLFNNQVMSQTIWVAGDGFVIESSKLPM